MSIPLTAIIPETSRYHRAVIFITVLLVLTGGLVRPVSAQSEDEAADEGPGRRPAAGEPSPPPDQSTTPSAEVDDERAPLIQFQSPAVDPAVEGEDAGEGDGLPMVRPNPVPPVPVPTPDIPAIQAEYRRRYPPLGEPRARTWPRDRNGAPPSSRRLDEPVSAPFGPLPPGPSGALPGPVRASMPGETGADSRAA